MAIDTSKFWVVAVISNPVRSSRRVELFRQFLDHMNKSGAQVMVCELQTGRREFEFLDNPANARQRSINLRSYDELWHKEAQINLAIGRLPSDWKYVSWIDADIQFMNPNWVEETVQALQHYMFIQPWETCVDLGPQNQIIQTHKSFCSEYVLSGGKTPPIDPAGNGYYYHGTKKGSFWHPGYAWAARREALEFTGGLMDHAILGSGDHHMARALVHDVPRSYPKGISPSYSRMCLNWQERCKANIKKDIGYIQGAISHYWHGKKANRQYVNRWDILVDNKFDVDNDIQRDTQGLWQLVVNSERQIALRDGMRAYFRQRNEDSIDL
jgi:hypothetical protein